MFAQQRLLLGLVLRAVTAYLTGAGAQKPQCKREYAIAVGQRKVQEEVTSSQCEWCASPQVWRVPTRDGWYVDGGRKREGTFHLMGAGQRRVEEETSLGWGLDCGPVDPVTHARNLGLDPEGTRDNNRVLSGTGQSKKLQI